VRCGPIKPRGHPATRSSAGNQEKLDYLFNWGERLEEAVKRLDVGIQLLEARLKISTASGDSTS
jgi:hypothetical protein